MTKTLRITGLAMVALAALASAGVAGVTIKRTPKVGEVTKYKMQAEVDLQGTPITFTGMIEEKTVKVDTDGSYTIEQRQTEGKVTMGGNEMDMPASNNAITTVYLPNGVTKEIKGEGASAEAFRMSNLSAVLDAGKELNAGDTWTYEYKADAKTGSVAGKAEYKYVGEEKVGETDTYKITMNYKESEGSSPATNDSTIWLDKTTGQLVKLEGKWANAPMPGAPMPINASVTMTRVP